MLEACKRAPAWLGREINVKSWNRLLIEIVPQVDNFMDSKNSTKLSESVPRESSFSKVGAQFMLNNSSTNLKSCFPLNESTFFVIPGFRWV